MRPSIHPPPRVRKKKRGVGLALETDLAQTATVVSDGGINPATDWAARIAGAMYAENFNYADTTALRAAAAVVTEPIANIVLTTEHALSGKTLRINVLDSDQASDGSWVQYLNGVDATLYQRFYLQLVMWQNTWLDWPYHLADNDIGTPKFIIIDRWNGSSNIGEVVGTIQAMRGFVTAYRLTATLSQYSGLWKSVSTPQNPANVAWQPAIDKGTPNPVVTQNDWEQRYGPCYSGMTGDYTLGQPLTGVPDPDAAIGGVPFAKGDHTVVTFFVHYTPPNGFIRIWAGRRGDPPEWICDGVLSEEGSADIYPRDINGYNGFHLLPYVTQRVAETGVRPNTYLDYNEVIVSANPIKHPGGFSLPNEPLTVLAAAAQGLSSGQWTTISTNDIAAVLGSADVGGGSGTIIGYANRMAWDPVGRKFYLCSADHNTGTTNNTKFAVYEDASNDWSQTLPQGAWGTSGTYGNHEYSNCTIDAANWVFYTRSPYDSYFLRKYNIGTGTWSNTSSSSAVLPYNQVASSLDYFPGKGIVWVQIGTNGDLGSVVLYNPSGDSWSNIQNNIDFDAAPTGPHSNVAVYSTYHNALFFGGGAPDTGGGKRWYRMASDNTITERANLPINLSNTNGGFSVLIEDPATGLIHAWGADGSHRTFNDTTNTWSIVDAPGTNRFDPPQNGSEYMFSVVGGWCSTYNVMCFAKWNGANSNFYVFKP